LCLSFAFQALERGGRAPASSPAIALIAGFARLRKLCGCQCRCRIQRRDALWRRVM